MHEASLPVIICLKPFQGGKCLLQFRENILCPEFCPFPGRHPFRFLFFPEYELQAGKHIERGDLPQLFFRHLLQPRYGFQHPGQLCAEVVEAARVPHGTIRLFLDDVIWVMAVRCCIPSVCMVFHKVLPQHSRVLACCIYKDGDRLVGSIQFADGEHPEIGLAEHVFPLVIHQDRCFINLDMPGKKKPVPHPLDECSQYPVKEAGVFLHHLGGKSKPVPFQVGSHPFPWQTQVIPLGQDKRPYGGC